MVPTTNCDSSYSKHQVTNNVTDTYIGECRNFNYSSLQATAQSSANIRSSTLTARSSNATDNLKKTFPRIGAISADGTATETGHATPTNSPPTAFPYRVMPTLHQQPTRASKQAIANRLTYKNIPYMQSRATSCFSILSLILIKPHLITKISSAGTTTRPTAQANISTASPIRNASTRQTTAF